ncbi:MAG: hypothetical protein M1828_007092, partial [Chrysothrix sp. TS-e1954]
MYLSMISTVAVVAHLVIPVFAASPCASPHRRQASSVPQYVLDYAPLVYLTTNDPYRPSSIGAQLQNTHPDLNLTAVPAGSYPSPLTLSNLNSLNSVANSDGGADIYLTSNGDYTSLPAWLKGTTPDSSGSTGSTISCAVITNDKGGGVLDAYYMYFYAYNQGNTVLGQELGDHLGDWEHNMIRFNNSKPSQIWYSEHGNGEAFTYDAIKKSGQRPIAYSGNGTHANWATVGTHDHAIPDVSFPGGPLKDTTNAGPLWDPVKAAYFYRVTFPSGTADGDSSSPSFTAYNGQDPTGYLDFTGAWGDDQLARNDPRQKEFFGFYKYTGGPTGPRDKDLNRQKICPNNGDA